MTGERPVGEDDLQALIDGRLASERRAAVEAYLAANPIVAGRVAADRALRERLRERLAAKAEEPIPARLRVAHIRAERRRRLRSRLGAAAAALAWLVVGGGAGWTANAWLSAPRGSLAAPSPAALDAIAAHRTFVVEVAHPVEVPAAQEAHLVQWLSRRLGRPISAPDLTGQGFRLMGGRLLPAGEAPAALFMYDDDRGTRLTLYVRADPAEDRTAFRFAAEGDVSAFSWVDRSMSYVVAARAERARLLDLAEAVHRQLDGDGAVLGRNL